MRTRLFSHAFSLGRAAVAAALAGVLVCGCTAPPPGADSSAAASAPDSSTAAESESVGMNANRPAYDTSVLADGKLRLLRGSGYTSRVVVFCGETVLYRSRAHETVSLLSDLVTGDTGHYCVTTPLGSDAFETTLYDKDGNAVYRFEGGSVSGLANGWLIISTRTPIILSTHTSDEPGNPPDAVEHTRFVNLASGEERPGPDNASFGTALGARRFLLNCTTVLDYDTYTTGEDTILYNENLEEVQRFEGCYCTPVLYPYSYEPIPGWICVSNTQDTTYYFYNVDNGTRLGNVSATCGAAVYCTAEPDGSYAVRALDAPETILASYAYPCETYWNGLAILQDRATESSNFSWYFDDGSGAPEKIRTSSDCETSLAVLFDDGTLAVYDTTGAPLYRIPVASADAWLTALPGGRCLVTDYTGEQSKVALYDVNGLVLNASDRGYDYLSTYSNGAPLLFAEKISSGWIYSGLYDVLDYNGNVLFTDLGEVYADYDSPNLLFARRGYYYGWMDYAGNWVYCESIFGDFEDSDLFAY